MAITKADTEGAKPRARPYDIRDGGRNGRTGLILRVYPSGRRTFFYQRKRGERWHKIGPAGPVTLQAARTKADEIFALLASGGEPGEQQESKSPTTKLGDFVQKHYRPHFLLHPRRKEKGLMPLEVFRAALFDKPLGDLSANLVKQWRDQRLRDGVSPATINRNVNSLRACLSFAVEEGWLATHPLAGLKRLPVAQENRVRYLSDDEEARLRRALDEREARIRQERRSGNHWRHGRGLEPLVCLDNVPYVDHLKPAVLLSMNTGIRQGELLALRWDDIVGDVLAVRSASAKSNRARYVPLNREAREVLNAWREQQGEDVAHVFTNPATGRPFDNFKKSWHATLANAGIGDFRWHDLRHHFASRLVMRGVPLNTVRELLGHSDLAMTLRYAHLSPGHARQAVELLDG